MIPNAHLLQADEQNPVSVFDSPKFTQAQLINKIQELIEPRLLKSVLYGTLEGKALVFYFNHNLMASEFMNKIEEFKAKIRPLYKESNMRKDLYFNTIKAKTKHRRPNRPPEKEPYIDRAKGNFEVNCKDDAVQNAFLTLRATIQKNNEGENSE